MTRAFPSSLIVVFCSGENNGTLESELGDGAYR